MPYPDAGSDGSGFLDEDKMAEAFRLALDEGTASAEPRDFRTLRRRPALQCTRPLTSLSGYHWRPLAVVLTGGNPVSTAGQVLEA